MNNYKTNESGDKTLEEKVIEISRVSRTVKGGKRISFRALVISGNHAGKVGIGMGKAAEVSQAIKKASDKAKKKMTEIKTNDHGSISRQVVSTFGSAKVLLRPAPDGTSIIAGGVVRTVCELSGVRNLVSKSYGSSNKRNTALATINGLVKAGQNDRN